MPTVAIIGAGPLGRWLAMAAARAGYRVLLEDVMPGNLHHAREYIREQLGPETLPAVQFTQTIEDAVREADLVVDCVPDELESKLEILWLLDRMAPPRAVFATPTMRLGIGDLASCTYRPEKCIAMRAEAAELSSGAIKVIRLERTAATAETTVELVDGFWRALGFGTVVEQG